MFDDTSITLGAPGLFSIELFQPWIAKLMLAYKGQEESEYDLIPKSTKFSKAYYTKKVN
ncbi:MAG TPA: hypothetical protein VMR41_06415 [Patescibacteria group bacterium]|nr:hypothetical protein [Patescibacteria group bacterium]